MVQWFAGLRPDARALASRDGTLGRAGRRGVLLIGYQDGNRPEVEEEEEEELGFWRPVHIAGHPGYYLSINLGYYRLYVTQAVSKIITLL